MGPPVADYRSLFSLPAESHYLNCAYMAPASKRVAAAGRRAIERVEAPARLGVADFFEPAARVRRLFAEIIGAPDPDRVAIVPSVSYAMATIARNTPLDPGQAVVVVEEQFPSVAYTWRRACREAGATLRTVAAPDAVGERARAVGARFAVDGTQSVGALPFEVDRVRPGARVGAGDGRRAHARPDRRGGCTPPRAGLPHRRRALARGTPAERAPSARRGRRAARPQPGRAAGVRVAARRGHPRRAAPLTPSNPCDKMGIYFCAGPYALTSIDDRKTTTFLWCRTDNFFVIRMRSQLR